MGNIAQLSERIVEFYEKISSWEHSVVKGSGLSPSQMHAVEIVGQTGPLRMKELAAKLGITTGSLTVLVDRLERGGILARKPHASDRRSYLVSLTVEGERHFKQHHRLHLELTEEMLSGLSDAERLHFAAALEKIVERI